LVTSNVSAAPALTARAGPSHFAAAASAAREAAETRNRRLLIILVSRNSGAEKFHRALVAANLPVTK
jgi:hypothetical protein